MNNVNPTPTNREECLQHAYLISRYGSWIQNSVDHSQASITSIDLLGLPLDELRETIGVKDEHDDGIETRLDWDTILGDANVTAITQFDELYPKELFHGPAAPKVLFCRGNIDLLNTPRGEKDKVAIVGARKATGYGLEMAAKLGRDLADKGATVVSGMALGIDGAAHRGALERGKTIAVLPCGPDRPYPASHTRLYRQIMESGLIVSDQMPGADAWRWSFPARNRIIAALSGATVVAESPTRGGSMLTAQLAHQIGRPVGAVPGPVTAGSATGTNTLIKDGIANLIMTAEDIVPGLIRE